VIKTPKILIIQWGFCDFNNGSFDITKKLKKQRAFLVAKLTGLKRLIF